MASFSDYTENKILNMLLRKEPFDVGVDYAVYMALFKSDAGLEANKRDLWAEVNEPTSYMRVRVVDFGGYTEAVDGVASNVDNIEFPTALNDWGTITHTALMDAPVGGNILMWGPLKNPRDIYAGDAVRVRAGANVITLS